MELSVQNLLEMATHQNYFDLGLDGVELPADLDVDLDTKVSSFEKILTKFGCKLVDVDFFKKINKDDVVEIYRPNMYQIYRSLNFFKTCSYSPETLFATPWYELFYRSESINKEIFAFVEKVMKEKQGSLKYPIADHFLKETRGLKNVTKIKLGHICTLLDDKTGELFGFASTLSASDTKNIVPI